MTLDEISPRQGLNIFRIPVRVSDEKIKNESEGRGHSIRILTSVRVGTLIRL